MNETISLSLKPEQISALKKQYAHAFKESTHAYTSGQIHLNGCTLTLYTSNKVVFQGPEAFAISAPYRPTLKAHAGSDEVGTGDYFGPVVVVAAYVDEDMLAALSHLPITDSKQITDDMILKMAPEIMALVPHSALILENEKYNQIQGQNNLNAIKAKLHNQAYLHLKQRIHALPALCVIDQFTPESMYYKYLKDEKFVFRALHFETKAESKYPAVAIASILARYAFLKVWEKMEAKYDFTFPKGGGDLVNQAGLRFIEKYGESKLHEVAKVHFKNTEKIKAL